MNAAAGRHRAPDVAEARTLVVLDLTGVPFRHLGPVTKHDHLRQIADRFAGGTLPGSNSCDTAAAILRHVADQIEMQTKSPRIPEPGIWGVVEASTTEHKRRVFIRDTSGDGASWITPYFFPGDSTRRTVGWSELVDPTLIREGVAS